MAPRTSDISFEKASFIGLWVESVLYGCHLAALIFFLYLSSKRKGDRIRMNKKLCVVSLATLFALSTAHVLMNFVRGFVAFVSYQGAPHGAYAYLRELWAPTNVIKQAIYVTTILVSDSFALYRAYIALTSTGCSTFCKSLLLPGCSMVASIGCGYKSVHNVSQSLPGQNSYVDGILHWRGALLGLSLVTNTVVAMLIILFIALQTRDLQSKSYKAYFFLVLIQFGTISASLLTILVLYTLKMNANYIVLDSMPQISGIVSTAALITVHPTQIPQSDQAESGKVVQRKPSSQDVGKIDKTGVDKTRCKPTQVYIHKVTTSRTEERGTMVTPEGYTLETGSSTGGAPSMDENTEECLRSSDEIGLGS
ncbi:hypothetical protein GYMLUDRAFT_37930 [Collybiopsis luxurians FD-317 M1]|nr:hypothetical protein GYMLUDRAFT_37930 [Collybiopsis luxurians FD-317 M1]